MLKEQFKKAGLVVKMVEAPFRPGAGMDRIVQMDIQRDFRKGAVRNEYFRIYAPKGTLIQVRDTDKKLQQLVLLVRENATEFEETLQLSRSGATFDDWVDRIKVSMHGGDRIKKISRPKNGERGYIIVARKTTAQSRYFLMGVDERQLFIAQCDQPVTTVALAHQSLGRSIQFAEGRRRGSSADRQGEWFFLETDQQTRDLIENRIKKHRLVVKKKTNIGIHAGRAGGSPHTADELVTLSPGPELEHGFSVRSRDRVFVRGKVRHRDHKTVKFSQWREVIANSEGETARAGAYGVFWVD